MQKPHVIHFHFHGRRTGVTRSIENILPGLQNKFQAFVFGYGIDGPKISFGDLLKLVFRKMPVIIHVHRNNEMMLALLFRLLSGKFRLIATRHSETKPSNFTLGLLKQADAVIALIPTLNLPVPTVVIGHGIDTNFLIPADGKKIVGIAQKNIISVVGRVREAKGQATFVSAIAPLLKNHPDWCAVIVGKVDNVDFKKRLDNVIAQHQAQNQFYFLNETRDILSIYQASRAVVSPSYSEGFSLVPLEAMSCECIVIATDGVGIHSSLITDGQDGFLFEKGNANALQKILRRIFTEDMAAMAVAARKKVVSKWDVSAQVETLGNLYRQYTRL